MDVIWQTHVRGAHVHEGRELIERIPDRLAHPVHLPWAHVLGAHAAYVLDCKRRIVAYSSLTRADVLSS
jgi:hypothetical protein